MLMEVSSREAQLINDNRCAKEYARKAMRYYQMAHVVAGCGTLIAYRVDSRRHSSYAVEDDGELICYTTYKKGAVALIDYINKIKGAVK